MAINILQKLKIKNTFLFHWSHLSNKCLRKSQRNQCFQSPEIKLFLFLELDKNDLSRWDNVTIFMLLNDIITNVFSLLCYLFQKQQWIAENKQTNNFTKDYVCRGCSHLPFGVKV